jgi:hypothetical protein
MQIHLKTAGQLHFHEREYTAQLDPSPAALIHVLFDGVCHDSKKFSIGKCHRCDFICSARGSIGGRVEVA